MLSYAGLLLAGTMLVGQAEETVSHYEHLKGLEFYVGQWIGKGNVERRR